MAESSSSSSSPSSSPSSSTSSGSVSGPPKRVQNSATSNVDDTPEEDEEEMPVVAKRPVDPGVGQRMTSQERETVGPASGNQPPQPSQPKQKIRASSQDNVLEPDAMRGSEMHLRDVDVEDEEEARRDAYRTDDEKQARQEDLRRQSEGRERRAKAREENR